MITGEERIRELLGQLYGAVSGYEGRPAEYQAARSDSLAHELEDVIADFRKTTDGELPAINVALRKKKLQAITVLAEEDWKKQREAEGASASTTLNSHRGFAGEMDYRGNPGRNAQPVSRRRS
jgi:hypothetical protein